MKIFSVGFDFRTAPLEVRAKAYSKSADLLAPDSSEKIILSTCNRSELYALSSRDDDEGEATEVIDRWARASGLNAEEKKIFQVRRDQDCLAHLFRVASGMESMVVGESQIGGQVKKSYEEAIRAGFVGPSFHRIFQTAFKVAKKVRVQTEVGRLAVSIPSIGVKLAEKVFGNLNSRNVGIIGLGEIGRVAAEYFGSVQPKKLFLFNRTQSVADEIHEKFRAEGVSSTVIGSYQEVLERADVIVSAVEALLINADDLEKLDSVGLSRFVLDLSVPPSVDRSREFENIFLYGIDDLQKIAEENTSLRTQEVEKAEAIIQLEAARCWQGFQSMAVSETFEHLAKKVETITLDELKTLKQRVPALSERDWLEIEKMAHRLASKVVQDPMIELKTQLLSKGENLSDSESLIQFFRNIFRI